MTALRKILVEEEAPANTVRAPRLYVVTTEAPAKTDATGNRLMNIALFLAAPFFGLAYIIALPFVGIAVLAVLAARAAAKYNAARVAGQVLKAAGAVVGGPVIGLAYVVFFPFIGLGMLVWMAGKAATAKI